MSSWTATYPDGRKIVNDNGRKYEYDSKGRRVIRTYKDSRGRTKRNYVREDELKREEALSVSSSETARPSIERYEADNAKLAQKPAKNQEVIIGVHDAERQVSRLATPLEMSRVAYYSTDTSKPSTPSTPSNPLLTTEYFMVNAPPNTGATMYTPPRITETEAQPRTQKSEFDAPSQIGAMTPNLKIKSDLLGINYETYSRPLAAIRYGQEVAKNTFKEMIIDPIPSAGRGVVKYGSSDIGRSSLFIATNPLTAVRNIDLQNIKGEAQTLTADPDVQTAGAFGAIAIGTIIAPVATTTILGVGSGVLAGKSALEFSAQPSVEKATETTIYATGSGAIPKALNVLDYKTAKVNPFRKYYVEPLGAGTEPHKGGDFSQYMLKFKGEVINQPTREMSFGIERTSSGQFKKIYPVTDLLLRDVPSEFSSPRTEASLAGSRQVMASVTPNSAYLSTSAKKGEAFRVAYQTADIESLSGREFVGGLEKTQFFSAPTQKPTIAGAETLSAGRPQAYTYYAGFGDYSGERFAISLLGSKPGLLVTRGVPEQSPMGFGYVDLAQQTGFRSGRAQLSASTLKGVRSELELLNPIGTRTRVSGFGSFALDSNRLKLFSGTRIMDVTKADREATRIFNIGQIENRIGMLENFKMKNPLQAGKADVAIAREYENLARVSGESDVSRVRNADVFNARDKTSISTSSSGDRSVSGLGIGLKSSVVSVEMSESDGFVPVSVSTSQSSRGSSIVSIGSQSSVISEISKASSPRGLSFSQRMPSTSFFSGRSRSRKASTSEKGFSVSIGSSSSIASLSDPIISERSSKRSSSASSRRPSTPPPLFSSKSSPSYGGLSSRSFDVFVRRRKNWLLAGSARSESEALAIGVFKTKTSAAASFRIPGLMGKTPKGYYSRGDIYIQTPSTRISTQGEKIEITYKGIASQRMKSMGLKL